MNTQAKVWTLVQAFREESEMKGKSDMCSVLIIQFKPWIPSVLSCHGVTVLTNLESQT